MTLNGLRTAWMWDLQHQTGIGLIEMDPDLVCAAQPEPDELTSAPALDRSSIKRKPTRWSDASLAWWRENDYVGVAARLLEISSSTALLTAVVPPPEGWLVQFCLEGLESVESLEARVLRVSRRSQPGHLVLLRFSMPCPPELLQTAIRGTPLL